MSKAKTKPEPKAARGHCPAIKTPKDERHQLTAPAVEVRPGLAATPSTGPPAARAYRVYWPSTIVTEFQKKLAVINGDDPNSVPDLPYRNLRLPAVCGLLGISQTALYRLINKGKFPEGKAIDMSALERAAQVTLPAIADAAAKPTRRAAGASA